MLIKCDKSKCLHLIKRCLGTVPDLGRSYVPADIESDYNEIEFLQYFRNNTPPKLHCDGGKFSLILPPPNITGDLHLGHALTAVVQDVLIKWNKIQGRDTVWVPGLDHAGIATQIIVEKRLRKLYNCTRSEMGREKFSGYLREWANEQIPKIEIQLKDLNLSLDWQLERYTLDEKSVRAVNEAFIRLYEKDLIYRDRLLVNWSCTLQSTVSDIEVEHIQINGSTELQLPGYNLPIRFGQIWYIAYKLIDSDEEIIVATTRPETIPGDVAIAVNPQDQRYTKFVKRHVKHPIRDDLQIPIVTDPAVDMGFGTGAVKITPAHDQFDYDLALRHQLPIVPVFNEQGLYNNVKRFDFRDMIIRDLRMRNLVRDCRDHSMTIALCSRSGDVIEHILKPQWYLRCRQMALGVLDDVDSGKLQIQPTRLVTSFRQWLMNTQDWCISRQLWWGHRIPAYRNEQGWTVGVGSGRQDDDVLDTWFSSALQPLTALGWPDHTNEDLYRKYYPLDLMVTGHDIMFFWVAKMCMLGRELTGQLPFRRVYLHGVLCDIQNRKMSKSLGNTISPNQIINGIQPDELEMEAMANYENGLINENQLQTIVTGQKQILPNGLESCGRDALRFTLCSNTLNDHYIRMALIECHQSKLFGNKLWQAVKYTNSWQTTTVTDDQLPLDAQWILSRLTYLSDTVTNALDQSYELNIATEALKQFLYHEFCDYYVEMTKCDLKQDPPKNHYGHFHTLTTCLDVGFRLLAPFMPNLAYHLHTHLCKIPNNRDIFWELGQYRQTQLETDMDQILDVICTIRRCMWMFQLKKKHSPQVFLVTNLGSVHELNAIMTTLGKCDTIHILDHLQDENVMKNCVKDTIGEHSKIYVKITDEMWLDFHRSDDEWNKKYDETVRKMERLQKNITENVLDTRKLNYTLQSISICENKLEKLEYKRKIVRI